MSRAITISYELNPPNDTPTDGLHRSKTHEFSVDSKPENLKEYYSALRISIAQAKDVLGDELTAWRDAVGNRELLNESNKAKKDEDDDEDAEEEE